MHKKKVLRIPVFNAMTNEWVGSARFRRNVGVREYLDDVCEYQEDLSGDECHEVTMAIGWPVCAGWFDTLGGNHIRVILGEIVEE